jgi:hypothetical protein
MNPYHYKQVVGKAYDCGCNKYTVQKTQNVLKEQFGTDLNEPTNYKGLSIMDAYMKGYLK